MAIHAVIFDLSGVLLEIVRSIHENELMTL